MLSYKERDFVTLVFHELVHTILFFKDHINFNERFAEFSGRKAAISFYLQKETDSYNYFSNIELNNARLLSYRSYNYDMEELEKLFTSPLINEDMKAFIEYCKRFKKEKDPEAALSQAISAL